MGRIVYQQIDIVIASDATQDLWSVFAAASHKIKMHGWELTSAAVAAALMDITLLDHIIIADHSYFSFADQGLLV